MSVPCLWYHNSCMYDRLVSFTDIFYSVEFNKW
uniref:Uncharacterized protein n=1 Tax=Arundo donax TaxID=35708 RepID=A0A0A8ZKT7_ARUDO